MTAGEGLPNSLSLDGMMTGLILVPAPTLLPEGREGRRGARLMFVDVVAAVVFVDVAACVTVALVFSLLEWRQPSGWGTGKPLRAPL